MLRPKFLAVDFFCGAGGTTRGMLDAQGYVVAGLDKDEACRKTYVRNNPNICADGTRPLFLGMDLHPASSSYPQGQQAQAMAAIDRLLAESKAQFPGIPVLFAICAPCQPFTTLSRAHLSEDRVISRNRDRGLLAHACRFVERFGPDLILSENVPGITEPRYGGVWGKFETRLRGLGYLVKSRRVCTSDFGIPQHRKRTMLAAVRESSIGSTAEFELPAEDSDAEIRTAGHALEGLPRLDPGEKHADIPNHVARNLNELNRKRIAYAKPGESNEYLLRTPEGDLSLDCHRRVNRKMRVRCFTDTYTRMAPGRPSPTITTRCHSITNGRYGHPDVTQMRGISMREAARLQSFEDDYRFYPLDQIVAVAKMIGNAVPPALVRFYAQWLVQLYQTRILNQ
ncbi:MAG: DNA cytosine methyltransferase [Bacteroidota bacterium]|nr:DNA cytosine methyltransferase [Bacteroidota bacterium]